MSETVSIHEFDTEDAPERERFEITDDEQAAWAMRKLLGVRSKMAENEAIADAERNRIDAWLHHVNHKLESDVAYFESILTMYAQRQRETDDRKSIETPYGSVKSRQTPDKFKVVDQDAFLAWAESAMPEAINVKRTPALTALKKAATVESTDTLGLVAVLEHGEIVPGVVVEQGGINYNVEVSK